MIYRNMYTNISENTLKANIEQNVIAFYKFKFLAFYYFSLTCNVVG